MTTSTHDPFSARFDSIEIDSQRAPSIEAIDHALAFAAPSAACPDLANAGFYLIDDADGRFEIDREMGVVSLKDEATFDRERFAIHTVRMRVVEASGESYEMELKLRLTGRVPQMVGAEDALFDIPGAEARALASPAATTLALTAPPLHWTTYAAAHARAGKAEIAHTRRAFITPELPAASATLKNVKLALEAPLPPIGSRAAWSV